MRALIISRPDRVGDVVISTSCLAPIKEKYPGTQIYFVAAERMRPLLEGHPLLAGCLSLSADLPSEFKRLQADAIVHLQPNKNCYLAAHQAGLPIRIGYPVRFHNRQLTHPIRDQRKKGLQHEAAYNFDLLCPLDVALPPKLLPQIHLSETSRRSLQAKLPWKLTTKRFAVLNPSAHSKIARWPVENFLQLAARLQKEFDLTPVFVGADANDSIPTHAANYLNLAGQTDLGELGWLLKHARALITNDTGPSHLAAAIGCPLVTLFGRTAPIYGPTRWRPLTDNAIVIAKFLPSRPLERRHAHWRRCFFAISVEEVIAAVKQTVTAQHLRD